MKVIFLIDTLFSQRDYNRFGIDRMLARNTQIEFWDFLKCRRQKVNQENLAPNSSRINRIEFNSYSDLNSKSKDLINSFVIDLRVEGDSVFDKSWLQHKGALIIQVDQGLLPASVNSIKIIDYISYYARNMTHNIFYRLMKQVIKKILLNFRQIFQINPNFKYDVKISGGAASECGNVNLCIKTHSLDYNIFLDIGGESSSRGPIVFLDSGAPDHPDYELLSIQPYCSSELYYSSMNALFDRIEKDTGLRVIISAHPRFMDLEKISRSYNGREVVINKSAEMIRDAAIVLAHDTTSISFAILWSKPLLLVTTNQLSKNCFFSMKSFSSLLGVDFVNSDNIPANFDWFIEAKKPLKNYSYYKKMLIKNPKTPDKNSWDIFLDKASLLMTK